MTGLPSQFHLISNAMAGAQKAHEVVSQNIANVNTPGYQTQELDFEKFMAKMQSADANVDFVDEIPVIETSGLKPRADGNNVDIDRQLAHQKKNALMFQTMSQLLAAKMATIRKAISG